MLTALQQPAIDIIHLEASVDLLTELEQNMSQFDRIILLLSEVGVNGCIYMSLKLIQM